MTDIADVLLVHGGTPLEGEIRVRGAKNLVPKAMVAALLGSEPSRLRNVPDIRDVRVVRGLLQLHGVTVAAGEEPGELVLDHTHVESANVADIDAHAGSSRIPILFCGPLLHRLGHAFIPGLGGCDIGGRPIDFHFDVLRQFGAVIEKRADGQYLEAPQRLRGTKIRLPYPSVGATEQVLLTAVLAEGVTELTNAAVEPEIEDLICVLQKMGAIISMDTDRTIRITGVEKLGGYTHRAIPDRLEAASWASAALATEGNIYVRGAQQRSMMTFLNTFRRVGGAFEIDDEGIRFWHPGGALNAIALETDVHPGFQTDRECLGGSDCRVGQRNFLHSAVVSGPTKLQGADLVIPDLRGGCSYLIAALAAQGTSRVHGIDLINRGYENFMDKLEKLGAKVELPGKALG